MTNLKARRKLAELYKRGTEVRFYGSGREPLIAEINDQGVGLCLDEDGKPLPLNGNEVQLWVQPPSPFQREQAVRDAQAARARSLVRAKREKDSEEHLTILAFLADMSDETLIEYVLVAKSDEMRAEAERDVLARDEWEDLLQLQDALRQFDEMDEEELAANQAEFDAVMERDAHYGREVQDRVNEILDISRESMQPLSREQVEKQALDKRSEIVGNQAFVYEYERQMLFYAVRDFEVKESCFFGSARELAESEEAIQDAVKQAFSLFLDETGEVKNSSGAASGSMSSEPPNAPETSAPSIPEELIG